MTTWIALFRGLNVGGHGILLMKDLASALERSGCSDVKTYIQSGNAAFRSAESSSEAQAKRILKAIATGHGMSPRVFLMSQKKLEKVASANPFPKAEALPATLHVFFLAAKPKTPDLEGMDAVKSARESYALAGDAFYLHAPDGIGRSKLAAKAERLLGVDATARNWATVMKMIELAKSLDDRPPTGTDLATSGLSPIRLEETTMPVLIPRPAFEGARAVGLADQLEKMGRSWAWVFAEGIVYLILGVAAVSWPVDSTVSLTLILGTIFIIGGIVQVIRAIQFRNEAGSAWRVLQAVAALAAGLLMLKFPDAGMMGVAIAMTFYFFMAAAAKGILAAGLRPHRGWGWAMTSAVVSFLLGAYLIASFPISALWMPGLILGVDLMILGCSLCGFSLDLRNTHLRRSRIEPIAPISKDHRRAA